MLRNKIILVHLFSWIRSYIISIISRDCWSLFYSIFTNSWTYPNGSGLQNELTNWAGTNAEADAAIAATHRVRKAMVQIQFTAMKVELRSTGDVVYLVKQWYISSKIGRPQNGLQQDPSSTHRRSRGPHIYYHTGPRLCLSCLSPSSCTEVSQFSILSSILYRTSTT